MESQILLSMGEFYALLVGVAASLIFLFVIILFMKLTPAKIFLQARLRKRPLLWLKYRTGLGEFKVADDSIPGGLDVPKVGYFMATENSQVREKHSKNVIYDAFAEFGATIPREYGPIIQELKEKGLKINTFADYIHLVKLAGDKEYANKILKEASVEDQEHIKELIKTAKETKIEIKPYKTYKLHELAYMFPCNISPVYIDARSTAETYRKIKQMGLRNQFLITAAMAALVIMIGGVIAWKLLGAGGTKEIVIRTVQTGVAVAQTNLTNVNI